MSAEAAREGLTFDFSRVTITPNTQLAHQLIAYAQTKQVGDGVVEDIFSAYFLQGRDVGSRDELLQIAQRSGLEAARVTAMWDAGAVARDVAETEQQMRALDISGVPFFSGFVSKDKILVAAYAFGILDHSQHFFIPLAGFLTAGLTAFYMFRLIFKTFFGEPHDHHHYDEAHEVSFNMFVPLMVLAGLSLSVLLIF